jgi:hypothetical protein
LLFLLSLNTSLRFVAGVVVIAGLSPLSTLWISLIIAINYFHSLSNSCLLWRIEVEHLTKEGKPAFIRPQASFFATHGRRLQFYALSSVFLIGVSVYLFSTKYPPLQWIDNNSTALGLWWLPLLVIIILALISGLIYVLVRFVSYLLSSVGSVLRRIRPFDHYMKDFPERFGRVVKVARTAASLLGSLLLLIGLISVIINVRSGNVIGIVWSYLIHNLGFMLTYENADFADYTMAKLKVQMAVFRMLLPIYLFAADSKLSLLGLVAVLLDYNKALVAKRQIENNISSLTV